MTIKDRPEWQYEELETIDLPTSLRNPSEAVLVLQRREDKLHMTGECLRRALLIVQAIDTTCNERGYSLKARRQNQYEWMNGPNYRNDPEYTGHLEVGIGDNTFVLALSQESAPPKTSQTSTKATSAADRIMTSPRVKIRILGRDRSFWRHEWSESNDGAGIEYLPRLFQELELRAQRADDERRCEEEQRIRTLRKWEAIKIKAKEQFIRDKKLALLNLELQRRKLVSGEGRRRPISPSCRRMGGVDRGLQRRN